MQPRDARAENSVPVKYQDYREAGGRIAVQVRSALFEQDLGSSMHLKVTGIMDTITGASPDGVPPPAPGGQVPLSSVVDERKAWALDFSRRIATTTVTAGVANSRESDYVSHGWSLSTLTDFNSKNTGVVLAVAGTDDDIRVLFQAPRVRKRTTDVLAGVNQLLNPRTAITFNVTYSRSSGYLGDPYKFIQKRTEVFPGVFLLRTFKENRPDQRNKWTVLAAINRAYPEQRGALEASYRFHTDDFGMRTHTLNLEWYQKLGAKFILRPSLRLLHQRAADFYRVSLNDSPIVPTTIPTGLAPYYSSDYRLSELDTVNYGLKAIWTLNGHWQIDAAIEQYVMRGLDGVTSDSAYPRATTATFGVNFQY